MFTHKSNKVDPKHWVSPYDNHLLWTLSPTNLLYVSSSSVKTPLSWQVGNLVFIPVFKVFSNVLSMVFFLRSSYCFPVGGKTLSIPPPDPGKPWNCLHILTTSGCVHFTWVCPVVIPIVKDVILTEVVIRYVRNWFFQKPPLKLINLYLRWWGSDWCLVRLIVLRHNGTHTLW